ncbi:sensor histidine kinase [Pareuzebyella sediminis]|uniref:sensor histidine kinase n=1 Tax=Pareuzebyella sediminis TaxID=2607998 RepID=UPI0011EF9941|nr:PAS domain-containing sensor histidine kinase [Pareuzebyella sediminis]
MNLQLEPFFDLSMDCLCIANYEGYFQKVNPAFRQLLGYSEEELLSTLIADFIYEDDKERTAVIRQGLKNNRPLVNFENRYISKSGEKVWLQWTSIPLQNEQLIYAIAKDVTFKKELDNERNSQLSHLSKVNNELKQLSYTTSHDLRSPVNNLLSMVDLIDMTKIDDEDTIELLSFIRLSADGLRSSLNSFVDVLKKNEGLKEKVEEVFFDEVLSKVKSAISTLIRQTNTTFNVDFSGLRSVAFVSAYMESIFLNLITNSIKYARPDEASIINIKTTVKNGEKTFTFSDNGLGFDMAKVGHRIFNLNQTFHDNEDSKGVGLYLVHNQVTKLGGTIDVNSKVNTGTTFTIKFE